jgi:hypothetical protein
MSAPARIDNPFRTAAIDPAALAAAPSRIDLWARAIEDAGVRTMAEIGVWKGAFARAILERCPGVERYFMIDLWASLPDWNKPLNVDQARFDDVHAEAMAKTDFARDRRTVLRGRTKDVASMIPDGSLDFAYIDGDHTLRGVTIDLQRMLPKVRRGGFIGGDDFSENPWQHDERFEPTLVFPYAVFFAEAMNLPIAALPFGQFLIRIAPEEGFSFADLTGRYGEASLSVLSRQGPFSRVVSRVERRLGFAR